MKLIWEQHRVTFKGSLLRDVDVGELRIFGVLLRRASKKQKYVYGEYSTSKGDHIPDDVDAWREIKASSTLIGGVALFSKGQAEFNLFIHGISVNLETDAVNFTLNKDMVGLPKATLYFRQGIGPRKGPFNHGKGIYAVDLEFRDREQIGQYLKMHFFDSKKEKEVTVVEGGDSGSLLPLVAGLAIGALVS